VIGVVVIHQDVRWISSHMGSVCWDDKHQMLVTMFLQKFHTVARALSLYASM